MNLLTLLELSKAELIEIINRAQDIKAKPAVYFDCLQNKTLLMLFAKPSLRTRVSFEVAMTQLGGHAIYYSLKESKDSLSDIAKTVSRYVDIIMARLFGHSDLEDLARNSTIPVINGLTNLFHPCQAIADLFTIREKKKKLPNLKLAYVGDGYNNVLHSLLYGCSMLGINISIACPKGAEFKPDPAILEKAKKIAKKSNSKIEVLHKAEVAVRRADIVYTDTWMSYHIPKEKESARIKIFKPFQVNQDLMAKAKPEALFMHCLPATRGQEVAAEVIDGPQSIVFDQAENRLHTEKAIILKLLKIK